MKICVIPGSESEISELEKESENERAEPMPDEPSGRGKHRREAADDPFGQNFHRMFDSFFSGKHPFFCPEGRAWNPPTDIFETEDALHIKIEVAGLRESDIEVKVNQDYLMIQGHRSDDGRTGRARFHLMEIHYGSFERIIRLPRPVEIESITATLKNGFLLVKVPKDNDGTEYRIEIE